MIRKRKYEEDFEMTLEALRKDMVAAMKAKDKTTKDAVSSLVSAVKKLLLMKAAERMFRKHWLTV